VTEQEIDRALSRISSNRIAPRRKPRRGPARVPAYLAWLRTQSCVLQTTGRSTIHAGVVDPCHGPPNGTSQKGPDSGAVPMCRRHHDIQTQMSWRKFELLFGFSREEQAAAHFARWKEAQQ
jgi:hypothetical protein